MNLELCPKCEEETKEILTSFHLTAGQHRIDYNICNQCFTKFAIHRAYPEFHVIYNRMDYWPINISLCLGCVDMIGIEIN